MGANFNSHAHVERDMWSIIIGRKNLNFNSHAHVERDRADVTHVANVVDFNSHAHVERDIITALALVCFDISTHTLTWSVTGFLCFSHFNSSFQLTRSRGA